MVVFAVGCQVLTFDCRMSLLVVIVVGSWSSAFGCRMLAVDCQSRLSLTFSVVGAQLCLYEYVLDNVSEKFR